jgi:single-strand DNA-binding protein
VFPEPEERGVEPRLPGKLRSASDIWFQGFRGKEETIKELVMAGTYNRAIIIGRLGRDPDLRYTQGGTPVANMSLATDETYTDREGNRQKRTEWHKVVVWNRQAETVANYLGKGRMALVEGTLQTNKWQDNQGQNRSTTEIKAQRVVFMDSQQDGTARAPGSGGGSGDDPFSFSDEGPDDQGPVFPSEAGSMDDAPF